MHVHVESAPVELLERLAAVGALESAAHLHADIDRVGIPRMERDRFHVRQMVAAREGPLRNARHIAQRRQVPPVATQVGAHVQLGRLRAGVDPQLIARLHAIEGKNSRSGDALAPLLPGAAAVLAHPDARLASAGENRATGRLDHKRLDVMAAQLPALLLPGGAAVSSRQKDDSVRRADEQLGSGGTLLVKVPAIR